MSSPAVDCASGAGGTWPAISVVLPPVKELGGMAVSANVKVVAIGNAKVKGSPDRRLA